MATAVCLRTVVLALCALCSIVLAPQAVSAQHEHHMHHSSPSTSDADAGQNTQQDHSAHQQDKGPVERNAEVWTCSMHPQIRLPKPGKCPICHMNLIKVELEEQTESEQPELRMSEYALKLAEVQTSKVKHLKVSREVRLVGLVDYDETQLKHITAWVPGRIDRLYVDYTGIAVKKGDHMVYLYSPELVSAQEELLQSKKTLDRLNSKASALVRSSTAKSVQAAREKLKLLGLSEAQVSAIEQSGHSSEWITIHAPMGGVIIQKHVNEGMYVKTGSQIYTIADLTHLWLNLDAYESDLPWIRYGQKVEFKTEALPGKTFSGVVSFIQPFLDPKSRTVKVRVNVNNDSGLLKPNMFVTALIQADLASDGTVRAPSYEKKYICPMHPEVVSDTAESCSICGMRLVPAKELPFVEQQHKHGLPLVIPASAPLITGKRAVVYVQNPKTKMFSGREIVLGPKAGSFYTVVSGLQAGERVVTNGTFKLDADLQIRGQASMMNPKSSSASMMHEHGAHRGH